MNERLTELYKACRSKEALASQDQFKSANVLIGSEVEKFAELLIKECADICFLNRHYSGAELSGMIEHRLGVKE